MSKEDEPWNYVQEKCTCKKPWIEIRKDKSKTGFCARCGGVL
jgi:hypothetical protein